MELDFYRVVGMCVCFMVGFSIITAASTALLIGISSLFKKGVCALAKKFEADC